MKFNRLVLAAALVLSIAACSKVPAGNVGIKAYLLGGDKGVDTEELGPGRYWIGINEELYLFPTFTQNYTWTQACINGDCENEELGFQTSEGLAVTADVGISYHIDPNKAALIFQKYRRGVDEITDLYLRNMVRDSLVKNASMMRVEDVYGTGKTKLIEAVQKDVSTQTTALGIVIEKVYWIGELRLPPTVTNAINAKITATQMTQQRQNEVAQAKAEADKKVEAARGAAESVTLLAKAQADALDIKGSALARNPKVIELQAIEKWDGKLPVYNGGNGPQPFIKVN